MPAILLKCEGVERLIDDVWISLIKQKPYGSLVMVMGKTCTSSLSAANVRAQCNGDWNHIPVSDTNSQETYIRK